MCDPFGDSRGKFRFSSLKQRLLELVSVVEKECDKAENDTGDESAEL